MIDRIEAKVGWFPCSLSRSVYQFTIPSSGRRRAEYQWFRGREKRGLNPSRLASAESVVPIRHDKRRAYLFDRANASSLQTRKGLPFATGTFAIFRDVIVNSTRILFQPTCNAHGISIESVRVCCRPRSFETELIFFKSIIFFCANRGQLLKLFELKNIGT